MTALQAMDRSLLLRILDGYNHDPDATTETLEALLAEKVSEGGVTPLDINKHRFRAIVEASGLGLPEIAALLSVHYVTAKRWSNGTRLCSDQILDHLTLKVSPHGR